VGVNSIHFKSPANQPYEGLLFPRSGAATTLSHYSSVRSYSGNLYFNPVANSTTYKLTDGVNLFENNVSLSSKYLQKSDVTVMRLTQTRTGTSSNGNYGMAVGGSNTSWIRTTKNGLLPWSPNVGSIGHSSWNYFAMYAKTFYEGNIALSNKYLGKTARASDSSKLGGYTAAQFVRKNTDILISKSNAWLSLDSPSSGSNGFTQGAGISIGESGKKGANALHLTYTGDGKSYIGMGTVSSSTGMPAYPVLQMRTGSKDAFFQGDIYEKGVKLEDKYMQLGAGGWTLAWSGSEDSSVTLSSSHDLSGKEVIFVGSDTSSQDEITFAQTYIPVARNFHNPNFYYDTWGTVTYKYSNRYLTMSGDAGFRQIWYRNPIGLPNIGIVYK
jgi:hypothetical protein